MGFLDRLFGRGERAGEGAAQAPDIGDTAADLDERGVSATDDAEDRLDAARDEVIRDEGWTP